MSRLKLSRTFRCSLAGFMLLCGATLPAQESVDAVRSRKAMLTTEIVMHLEGESKGQGRMVLEGLLEQCNQFRQNMYKLPAQTLPEDVLHFVDTMRVVELFDGTGFALTQNFVRAVDLTDYTRWHKELAAGAATGSATPPARAPNCAVYEKAEVRNGYLWREGRYYRLEYKRKRAFLNPRRTIDAAPTLLDPPVVGKRFPQETIAGQSCSVTAPPPVVLGGAMGASEQCVWNDFGAVAWMNLPLRLRQTSHFGVGKKAIWEHRAESADAHPKFDKDTFAIPADFTVTGQ